MPSKISCLGTFKVLKINMFDNLVRIVHVTVYIFKSLFGKKKLKSSICSVNKEIEKVEKQI
jgi:hypothetical protein